MRDDFEISTNNAILRETCPACGEPHKDAGCPYWIFWRGTKRAICQNCLEEHAPDMLEDVSIRNTDFFLEEGFKGGRERGKTQAERKLEKIRHYLNRDPVEFYQFDGFADAKADGLIEPDRDGDWLCWGQTVELMHGATVRMLVVPGTPNADVLRLIDKIKEIVAREGFIDLTEDDAPF